MYRNKNKYGFHELPALLAIIVIIGIFAWYGYNNYFSTPERIYSQMRENMQSLQAGHVEAEADISLGGGRNLVDLFIKAVDPEISGAKITGDFDISNPESPKYRVVTETSRFSRDAYDVETRLINDQLFYLIDFVNDSQSTRELSYYPGTWFTQTAKPDINPSVTEKLRNIAMLDDSLISISELPDENIGKTSTYHYALEIDSRLFRKSFEEFIDESGIEFDDRETQDLFDKMTVNNAEVWIGKSDKYLYRVLFELESEKNNATVGLTTDVYFSDFNAVKEFDAPEEYMTIDFDPEDVMNDRMSDRDKVRAVHVNLIASALKSFYDTNGVLPDADGDPSSESYPASPTCISRYDKGCFDLKNAGYEKNDDYLVPNYMQEIPYEYLAGITTKPEYMTYERNGKLYVSATMDNGQEFTAERTLE